MQYSPYYRGHELVFRIENMERLSKQFKLSTLVTGTPQQLRKFVALEVPSPSQPRPWLPCACCLYQLGFGYERILRYLGVPYRSKRKLSCYFKNRRKRGLVKPPPKIKPKKSKVRKYIPVSPLTKLERMRLSQIQFKAKSRIRSYFSQWLSRNLYPRLMQQIVGCDRDFFKHWISSQFTRNMSWHNHGPVWHIDHKIPCKSFDLTKKSEVVKCWHFSNLRPLSAKKNILKSARIESTQNELLLNFSKIRVA